MGTIAKNYGFAAFVCLIVAIFQIFLPSSQVLFPVAVEYKQSPLRQRNQPRRNVIMTAYTSTKCNNQCKATQRALNASIHCAARSFGWEASVVTEPPEGYKSPRSTRQKMSNQNSTKGVLDRSHPISGKFWDGPGPYPHYMKIFLLDHMFTKFGVNEDIAVSSDRIEHDAGIDWALWVDADVRILNITYPINSLVEYATKQDIHLIVVAETGFDTFINCLFFVSNTIWGRRFVDLWKHLTIGDGSDYSCGYFDQCPFGVAMMQIIQDYAQVQNEFPLGPGAKGYTEWVLNRPMNKTLEFIAWEWPGNVQKTILRDEIDRITNYNQNNKTNPRPSKPVQVGPIMFLPSFTTLEWDEAIDGSMYTNDEKGRSHENGHVEQPQPLPQSSLLGDGIGDTYFTGEGIGNNFFHSMVLDYSIPWPLATHAKYINIICADCLYCYRPPVEVWETFATRGLEMHGSICTVSEIESYFNPEASCWARWPPPNSSALDFLVGIH